MWISRHFCGRIAKENQERLVWCDFDRASSLMCGNKMPTRCNRGFYCKSYVEQTIRSAIKTPLASSWHFISTYQERIRHDTSSWSQVSNPGHLENKSRLLPILRLVPTRLWPGMCSTVDNRSRSRWPPSRPSVCGRSLLGLRVRIPPGEWFSVSCDLCVVR